MNSSRPLFSLLHPTARPDGWRGAMDAWHERCDNPGQVEYVLCVDKGRDDAAWARQGDWAFGLWQKWHPFKFVVNEGRRCAVDAWNEAAKASTGWLLITVADDYRPPEHWDSQLHSMIGPVPETRNCKEYKYEYVLDVDNGDGSDHLLPFSFISRAYYERLGCLFWPEYFGLGADNDFTERARRDGVVSNARHIKFSHPQLPADDLIYQWQHRPEAEEAYRRVFSKREAQGFPYGAEAVAAAIAKMRVATGRAEVLA
jgi:hypothetical protein